MPGRKRLRIIEIFENGAWYYNYTDILNIAKERMYEIKKSNVKEIRVSILDGKKYKQVLILKKGKAYKKEVRKILQKLKE